jgi:hypothetical protein
MSSEWISSAGSWSYPHILLSFANLPSGNATWHNLCFALFVCRVQYDDQDEDQDHQEQELHVGQQCSLGHLVDL